MIIDIYYMKLFYKGKNINKKIVLFDNNLF